MKNNHNSLKTLVFPLTSNKHKMTDFVQRAIESVQSGHFLFGPDEFSTYTFKNTKYSYQNPQVSL